AEPAVAFLVGQLRQGRIGLGGAAVAATRDTAAAPGATLTLADVDGAFAAIARAAGSGAQPARLALLAGLLQRATADEQDFLRRLTVGELRQGALEALLLDAVALAADVPIDALRRAAM